MAEKRKSREWLWWLAGAALLGVTLAGGLYSFLRNVAPTPVNAGEQEDAEEVHPPPRVEVVRPQKGGMDHTTTQPGSVIPFDEEHIVPQATGKLKLLTVDIGDRVKKGQLLAQIDVPDLEAERERAQAALERAQTVVKQMEAHLENAHAELAEAEAKLQEAIANARSKAAYFVYRDKQYRRYSGLLADNAIDARLVDEERDRRDAAEEAKNAAEAAVVTAKARVISAQARIKQAEADLEEARAQVTVNQAQLHAAQVAVDFATIRSDYDGVVTMRSKFPGDFIRSGAVGTAHPLLTIQRTDKFRVVVLVPDADVPYVDVGDPAIIEFTSIPGWRLTQQKVPGKKELQPLVVSRLAQAEDPKTRLMRVEIDLYNQDGKIKAGMFGNVTIILDRSNLLALPSSCVINRDKKSGQGDVFVVREGKAYRRRVAIGPDNGVHIGIRAGLTPEDQVVLHPLGLEDGQVVEVISSPSSASRH
jgi:HlyD family secretion protein